MTQFFCYKQPLSRDSRVGEGNPSFFAVWCSQIAPETRSSSQEYCFFLPSVCLTALHFHVLSTLWAMCQYLSCLWSCLWEVFIRKCPCVDKERSGQHSWLCSIVISQSTNCLKSVSKWFTLVVHLFLLLNRFGDGYTLKIRLKTPQSLSVNADAAASSRDHEGVKEFCEQAFSGAVLQVSDGSYLYFLMHSNVKSLHNAHGLSAWAVSTGGWATSILMIQ